ncbi:MAG: UDP-N-acetylmuramoyl-tripeptide--D-alanyl-D-alanine ligase [Flavobacteriales bacterium]|nr:UDP-N-acetylmuramoyl-tripeptide--D-alanyl-D-alanine ligase [Flavobacteriales bacterium]
MGIEELYNLYKKSYKVVKDTREDVTNSIYFSLKGESFNGNQYALQALENGANYAVIDQKSYHTDKRMILVEDVLTCLQELSNYHRQQLDIQILALTGSNGKTTTKELINAVLNEKYNCYATKGNLNNHIGVPLTLLSMTPEHNFGVVEMGANHQLEIADLCDIALPDFGFITNFGRVHLEGFGSFEGVVKGKTEMYRHLQAQGKKVFVNQDDPIQMDKSIGMDRVLFGPKGDDYQVTFIGADPFVSISFEEIEMDSQLIGSYNYANIAAAVSIGKYFGIETKKIKNAIQGFVPDNNRSQIITRDSNRIILDAYNANPNSMEVAIDNLKNLSAKNKVAILGDMFELGKDADLEHQRITDLAANAGFDRIFLIGEAFSRTKTSGKGLLQFSSFEKFTESFDQYEFIDTTLLVKASRGMALERILTYL